MYSKMMSSILNYVAVELVAIFVAFLSLLLTAWIGVQERRHSRLSVKSAVIIRRIFDTSENELHIALINTGLGPLKISNYSLTVNGVCLHTDHPNWYEALSFAFSNDSKP